MATNRLLAQMVLLTGATGHVGGEIVRLLRQAQVDVRALVRVGSEYFWLNDTGATYFFGDLRDEASLRRALQGCSHVIHAAGVTLESHDNHHHSTTLEGGLALVDAARGAGVEHFVQIGCAAVTHSSHVQALACQAEVEAQLAQSGLSHTILRSTPFLEEFAQLARTAKEGRRAVLWGSGDAQISPISRRDLALVAISALDHPAATNRVLTVGGPQTTSAWECVRKACELADCPPQRVQRLSGAKRALARRSISLVLGRRWENFIDWQAALYDVDLGVEGHPISELFDLPLTSIEAALEDALVHRHPREDPTARDERVVHRQFHATVYTPGEAVFGDLPGGPDDRSSH